jgi:uncharacterized protein (TIGR03067 family)
MKPRLLIVLVAGLLLAADDAKKDVQKFQGEWTLVSAKRDGQDIPEEMIKGIKRTIKGDDYSVTRDGETLLKGKFKVDPSKKPKTIDLTFKDQSGAEVTALGVYDLDGDNLKICYSNPGKDRPKDFVSETGITLGVWKRAKK